MTDKEPDYGPIPADAVPWQSWGRGERFGIRFRQCRYVIIGEKNPNEVSVYPDSNKVQVRWLDERYDRAARREYWDGEE